MGAPGLDSQTWESTNLSPHFAKFQYAMYENGCPILTALLRLGWESKKLSRTVPDTATIRVQLPYHLRTLAHIDGELNLAVPPPITIRAVLDTLEARYPMLAGTIREHDTFKRRPFLRFFACQEDVSLQPSDTPLPALIAEGKEPLLIIGAIAGG
jgi:sulfur-carrier protein